MMENLNDKYILFCNISATALFQTVHIKNNIPHFYLLINKINLRPGGGGGHFGPPCGFSQ